MKTTIKIALIAAITALAVLSCEPAITKPHNEYFDEYNEQFDAKYTRTAGYNKSAFSVTASSVSAKGDIVDGSLSIGDKAINRITLTIGDTTADVYKAKDPEAKLKEFFIIYTFNPTELTAADIDDGKIHTLTALSGWSLERKSGSTSFVIKMPSTFTAASSNLVWKINGDKYTFRDGLKMDINNNDIAGEAVFDDVYGDILVDGITNSSTKGSYPKNTNFAVALSISSSSLDYPSLNNGTGFPNFPLAAWATPAAVETSGIYGTANIVLLEANSINQTFLTAEDKNAVLRSVISGIKMEKFTEADGKWTPAGFSAALDETVANHRIIIKDFKATHMTAYRIVVEKSSINFETGREFYGVKQRFNVTFNGGTVSEDRTSPTIIEGTGRLYSNPAIRNFVSLEDKNYLDSPGTITESKNTLKIPDSYKHTFNYSWTWTWTWTYTHTYTWTGDWLKNTISVNSKPNPAYDLQEHTRVYNDGNIDTSNTSDPLGPNVYTTPPTITIAATSVYIDDTDYYNFQYLDETDGYTKFYYQDQNIGFKASAMAKPTNKVTGPVTNPTTKTENRQLTDTDSIDTTTSAVPTAPTKPTPAAPDAPAPTPPAGNVDWTWDTSTSSYTVNTNNNITNSSGPVPNVTPAPGSPLFTKGYDINSDIFSDDQQIRDNRFVMELSKDSNGRNVVLKLTFGPNSVKNGSVTTRNYIKQLDLAAFKENFKIIYSKGSDTNPIPTTPGTGRNDVKEIGIAKVEFVQEKTALDTFVDSSTVKHSGFNVIFITLDPDYSASTDGTRTKYFYIGSGFGYTDGINIFSSSSIWVNKGFGAYSAGNGF